MELFNFLKEDGEAKKRDLDFLYKIQECGIQLQDDDDPSEDALIEDAAIGDEYSSTTLSNTTTLATVRKFHHSAVTRAERGANTDAKTDAAPGVTANIPNLQFWELPPGRKTSKRKYGRRKNSVTWAESHKNADSKTYAAPGVGVYKIALQFWRLPLEPKKSNKKTQSWEAKQKPENA